MSCTNDREVAADTLAEWLGTSSRQVRAWAQAGVAARSDRGRYLLKSSVQAVVAQLREAAAGRGDGSVDLARERALLARSQREATELKMRRDRGELVPADEPERELLRLSTTVSGRLQGVASGVAPELVGVNVADAERIVADAIADALRDLAERAQKSVARLESEMQEGSE